MFFVQAGVTGAAMSGVVASEGGRRTQSSIPVLHSGSHFRHGLLQLMIHTIDPLNDGENDCCRCIVVDALLLVYCCRCTVVGVLLLMYCCRSTVVEVLLLMHCCWCIVVNVVLLLFPYTDYLLKMNDFVFEQTQRKLWKRYFLRNQIKYC